LITSFAASIPAVERASTLGVGTLSSQAANAVAITGGSITGITDLALADGGTGASTFSAAQINLGFMSAYSVVDQTVNASDVLVDATSLSLILPATQVWAFDFVLAYSSGTTPDIKFSVVNSGTALDAGWWGARGRSKHLPLQQDRLRRECESLPPHGREPPAIEAGRIRRHGGGDGDVDIAVCAEHKHGVGHKTSDRINVQGVADGVTVI
jgi:hypothetical protein